MSQNPAERKETVVRVYTSPKDFERDTPRFAAEGWIVASVTHRQPRRGCGRILLMGVIFAFIFPPKPELVVTYERTVLAPGYARCYSCGTINRYERTSTFCTNCGKPLRR